MKSYCKNCQTELVGTYCHDCSEKVLTDKDFEVLPLLGRFFANATNVNSKLIKSMGSLIFRPGALSAHNIAGIRKPYLSPIQIFLISGILYFVLTREFDVFYMPSKMFFLNLADNAAGLPNSIVLDKMIDLDLTRRELALKYDVNVGNYAKAFLFLLIPMLAIGSYMTRFKTVPQLGKHLIFAVHNFSFIILWFTLLLLIAFQLPNSWTPDWLMRNIVFFGALIYFVRANCRTWGDRLPRAVFTGFIQILILCVAMFFYRSVISFATLILL